MQRNKTKNRHDHLYAKISRDRQACTPSPVRRFLAIMAMLGILFTLLLSSILPSGLWLRQKSSCERRLTCGVCGHSKVPTSPLLSHNGVSRLARPLSHSLRFRVVLRAGRQSQLYPFLLHFLFVSLGLWLRLHGIVHERRRRHRKSTLSRNMNNWGYLNHALIRFKPLVRFGPPHLLSPCHVASNRLGWQRNSLSRWT